MLSKNLARHLSVALVILISFGMVSVAQQVADPDFKPPIASPAYNPGRGPVVLVDEAHHNFHTATGRSQPFAELLRRDGYRVEASAVPFTKESLKRARMHVISNAPEAPRNAQLLLNVLHWLSGKLNK